MKRTMTLAVLAVFFMAATAGTGYCDELITTAQASTSGEHHSYRQVVSVGDQLIFEIESSSPPANVGFTIPLAYSIPNGFTLNSAVLEFSIAGTLNTNISGFSVPLEDVGTFSPATLNPTVANQGPLIVVYVGDQSFLLMSDVTNGSTAVDLVALGYGDLLVQGAPVTIWGNITLFSYIAAGQAPWWGTNAFSEFRIDQTWQADLSSRLTLDVNAVPEPGTLVLVGGGMAIAAWKNRRRTITRA